MRDKPLDLAFILVNSHAVKGEIVLVLLNFGELIQELRTLSLKLSSPTHVCLLKYLFRFFAAHY